MKASVKSGIWVCLCVSKLCIYVCSFVSRFFSTEKSIRALHISFLVLFVWSLVLFLSCLLCLLCVCVFIYLFIFHKTRSETANRHWCFQAQNTSNMMYKVYTELFCEKINKRTHTEKKTTTIFSSQRSIQRHCVFFIFSFSFLFLRFLLLINTTLYFTFALAKIFAAKPMAIVLTRTLSYILNGIHIAKHVKR